MASDSQGNVYVADYNNYRIQKLDISTGKWSSWGKSGGAAGCALGEFNSPTGIAVDSRRSSKPKRVRISRILKGLLTAPSVRRKL
ncbi:DNA-binding beta-propeller fold protein YncE [Paenibacillus eucommiae]|uniref:DNA-binding beta-propeller fold protein YncE n=1 Tax=Paenibacillus eucommiae TaxID=1355755 RepID=A0ABS4J8N0_9BACL|nr:DNA-binding beta-propeller fold protein YncE [Paenibacillus eucommiae]